MKKLGVILGDKPKGKSKCKFVETNEAVFVGIDPSLTATGIVVLDQDACVLKKEVIKTTPKQEIEERFIQIIKALRFIPHILRLKRVYIEGISYGSKGNRAYQLGALHFMIRLLLYENRIKYSVIAPKTLKVFHAKDANADKNKVVEMVEAQFGETFSDHNLADAYGLARMALEEHYNEGS
jgi:Holliday junction resolvasome RuvABC endonuclease subunit